MGFDSEKPFMGQHETEIAPLVSCFSDAFHGDDHPAKTLAKPVATKSKPQSVHFTSDTRRSCELLVKKLDHLCTRQLGIFSEIVADPFQHAIRMLNLLFL